MDQILVKQLNELCVEQKTFNSNIRKSFSDLQRQVDAIDLGGQRSRFVEAASDSIGSQVIDSAEFKAAASAEFAIGDRKIIAAINHPFAGRKSIITTTSGITAGVSGVTMPMRLPGITGIAMQGLRIRDLMGTPREMTTGNAFDFVQQLTRTNSASPQVETSPKGESTYAWNTATDTVKTIAHFVNVSRQALDDVPWLRGVLDSELMYGLLLKEETEILSGDGLGQHMNGIIKQATAYNTGLNISGDTQLDKLRHAKLQARLAGLGTFAPDAFVLNPTDLEAIELLKTEEGGANKGMYIVGNPSGGAPIKMIWDLPVVESDSITAGTFLVGAFATGAEIIDRMQATVEISIHHDQNFVKNLATILCECRTGLAVRKPGAFIYGSY